MEIPGYLPWPHGDLEVLLKQYLNRLGLRDWTVELLTAHGGDTLPEQFSECEGHPGAVEYDEDTLYATILINRPACVAEDRCPANALAHEVAHIFLNDSRSEEVKCNVIAELLGNMKRS